MEKSILKIITLLFLCLLLGSCAARSPEARVAAWEKSLQEYEAGSMSSQAMTRQLQKNLEEGAEKKILEEPFGFATNLQADLLYRTVNMQASLHLSEQERKQLAEKNAKYHKSYYGGIEMISQQISPLLKVGDQQVLVLRIERKHPRYGTIRVRGSLLYKKYYLQKKPSGWKITDYAAMAEILWQDDRSDHTKAMMEEFFSDIGGEPQFREMP